MKRTSIATASIATALALAMASVASAQAEPVIARVSAYEGALDILRSGIPLSLYPNMPVFSGDIVHTRDGRLSLRFNDLAEVRLQSDSRVTVTDGSQGRQLAVEFGGIRLSSPSGTCRVISGGNAVTAQGAVLEYVAHRDGRIVVGVLAGTATVSGPAGTSQLAKGQQLRVATSGPAASPQPFEAGQVFGGDRTVTAPPAATPPPTSTTPPPKPTAVQPQAPVSTPPPSATPAPIPAATPAPIPAATPAPMPAATPAPIPAATPAPIPAATPAPIPAATPASALQPAAGNQPVPSAPSFEPAPVRERPQTQGEYAARLVHALGIANALPRNATVRDIVAFLEGLRIEPCRDRPLQPSDALVPFPNTGDLLVLDSGSGNVLGIESDGKVAIAISRTDLLGATGGVDVSFTHAGVALDRRGAMYLVEGSSGAILRVTGDGTAALLTPAADLPIDGATGDGVRATPAGLAVGGDGLLYVTIATPGALSLVEVDPETGEADVRVPQSDFEQAPGVTSIVLSSGLVASDNDVLYLLSKGEPKGLLRVEYDGSVAIVNPSSSFSELDGFVTRTAAGDLVVVDRGANTIYKITPSGERTVLVDREALQKAAGGTPRIGGGIAFDGEDNLYVVDAAAGNILKFSPNMKGKVWIKAEKIQKVTGAAPVLDGGIAFGLPMGNGWQPNRRITTADLACIAGLDPDDPDTPIVLPLELVIEEILERNGDLFWLQTKEIQTVSPFAP